MQYLVFLLITIALLAGFLFLTAYEARRGSRILASYRSRLDAETARIEFIVEHVDLAAYLHEEGKGILERIGHDIAHISLQGVRGAERILTRTVRRLRTQKDENIAPRETTREFVKTLADFKGHLEANRPEIPDINEVE